MIEFKRIALSLIAAGSLFSSPQALAQQSSNGNESQGASAYNWNGFYGGGNLGGAFGGSDFLSGLGRGVPFIEGELYPPPAFQNPATPAIIAAYRSNEADVSSFSGGLQAGYNFWNGGLLFGVEADINFLNAKSSKTTSAFGSPGFNGATTPTLYTFRNEIDASYLASLRPRVGIPVGGILVYATGGLAVTTLKYNHTFSSSGGAFGGLSENASASETKAGWTLGAGAEIPFAPSMSLKAEYLFSAFGNVSTNDNKIFPLTVAGAPAVPEVACGADTGQAVFFGVAPNTTPRQCFNHKADLFLHSVRLGLNFKF